jgi:hypothetical protein
MIVNKRTGNFGFLEPNGVQLVTLASSQSVTLLRPPSSSPRELLFAWASFGQLVNRLPSSYGAAN